MEATPNGLRSGWGWWWWWLWGRRVRAEADTAELWAASVSSEGVKRVIDTIIVVEMIGIMGEFRGFGS